MEFDGALRDLATVRSEYPVSMALAASDFQERPPVRVSRTSRRRIAVFDALDLEWARLVDSPHLIEVTARWARTEPELAGLAQPAELLAAGQDMSDQPRIAAITYALTRIASDDPDAPESVAVEVGDQDTAVRVLVQMLLPGLKALCARAWWMPHHPDGGSLWLVADQEECAAVALELLIAAIRGYRWRSRRGPANLNLLGGTRTRLTRLVLQARTGDRRLRMVENPEAAAGTRGSDSGDDEHVFYTAALIDLLRWALRTRVLSQDAARLVALTRLADRSSEELAAAEGVAVPSLRRRRQRAESTLASAARAAGRWPLPQAV